MQVLYNKDHLESHSGDFTLPINQVIGKIRQWAESVSESDRKGRVATVIFPEDAFGFAGVIATPDRSKVFWGYREGRNRPSPFIRAEKREEVRGLVVICQW